jgi:hypothetical protein
MGLSKQQSKYKHKAHKSPNKYRHSKSDQVKNISKKIADFFEINYLNEIAKITGYLIRNAPITDFHFHNVYEMEMKSHLIR